MPRSDKGRSHKRYDMRLRTLKKLMRDLRRTLVEAAKPRREGRPRSERRAENREAELPANRICPGCGEVKLRSKQWVVTPDFLGCLACYRRRTKSHDADIGIELDG